MELHLPERVDQALIDQWSSGEGVDAVWGWFGTGRWWDQQHQCVLDPILFLCPDPLKWMNATFCQQYPWCRSVFTHSSGWGFSQRKGTNVPLPWDLPPVKLSCRIQLSTAHTNLILMDVPWFWWENNFCVSTLSIPFIIIYVSLMSPPQISSF